MSGDGITLTGPDQIAAYRLLVLYHAMKLEAVGLRHSRGRSVTAQVKAEFQLKGRRARVIEQFAELLTARGILPPHAPGTCRCGSGLPPRWYYTAQGVATVRGCYTCVPGSQGRPPVKAGV